MSIPDDLFDAGLIRPRLFPLVSAGEWVWTMRGAKQISARIKRGNRWTLRLEDDGGVMQGGEWDTVDVLTGLGVERLVSGRDRRDRREP